MYVRVVPGEDGRLGIAELRVVGTPNCELLRSIPMGRIDAAANAAPALDRGFEPVTTAHRWIKEARERGFLGPGRPGKAG